MATGLNVWEGLLLGVVQGVTEFLPVSSSGHLVLARNYLAIPNVPLLFDVLLHVATLVVILYHYRTLVGRLVLVFFRFLGRKQIDGDAEDLRFIVTVVVATILTVFCAFLFRAMGIDSESTLSVSVLMLVTAFLLASTTFAGRMVVVKDHFTWKQALVTGIAQGFGTLAGISRSGITLSASLWTGMKRERAGEYTFILSVPAVLGALVLTLAEEPVVSQTLPILPVLVGCVAALVTGLAALRLLLWMVRTAKLWYFSIYLVVLGVFGLIATV